MNNIYLFTAQQKYVWYDSFDAHVVIASTAKEARKMIMTGRIGDEGLEARRQATYKKVGSTKKKPQIVLSSFRAG